MYKARIKHLEEMHQVLNKQIDAQERNHPLVQIFELAEMMVEQDVEIAKKEFLVHHLIDKNETRKIYESSHS